MPLLVVERRLDDADQLTLSNDAEPGVTPVLPTTQKNATLCSSRVLAASRDASFSPKDDGVTKS